MIHLLPLLLILVDGLAQAATVTYDFNITWVTADPDGVFARPVIGINGQWPIPHIEATVGDRLVINVLNQLVNQSTSLHFHGLYMNGSTHMDGPVGVTQCGITPGERFKYDFVVAQPGTYWYHSHDAGQYPDGLRGALIVSDPDSPYKGHYDEEIVLTLSDWYHEQMPNLMKRFISVTNPTGAEPIPQAALMNDTQNLMTPVEPGKTYMFRIINMAAFAGQYFWFEGHTMRIVEVDGIYTEAAEANMIYLTAAQRYSVLISTKTDASANFAYMASMDQSLFDKVPPSLNPNVTGWLVYDNAAKKPFPTTLNAFDSFDDFNLVPFDRGALMDKVDYSFNLDVKMNILGNGANYAFFNDITYVRPRVPSLYTALSSGPAASNASIYGVNAHAFILMKNDVVQIIVNNDDPGRHPFHLHGHAFQTVVRSNKSAGFYVGNETFPKVPMRRDTIMVQPHGNVVLRFRADNPDKLHPESSLVLHPPSMHTPPSMSHSPSIYAPLHTLANRSFDHPRIWLFHCHIEWHVASGLVATMIESPLDLQSTLSIPPDHLDACRRQNIPTAGNAAGNTADLFDLTGVNVSPDPLPEGFTARGVVALVFSCLSALLGVGVVAWYGASETGNKEPSLDTKEKVVRPEHVAEAEVEVEPKTGHVEDSLVG